MLGQLLRGPAAALPAALGGASGEKAAAAAGLDGPECMNSVNIKFI
jgi:hypothetical protein